ncbi:adp-ribosylation factor-like protein 13b [Holotrichia oblita]|uniref:Adp-ribosylation factor-like protein 13b n=1 Tax=Holotrichia oblita TaxID=644536 RepID=A0ACB9TXI2_HOLOL|nr:adp-ribosylation factor-like protein 13b [Holotrichia oblita]
MGNCCCLKKKPRNKIVLLLLGLDNAGKTVAAKNLAGEPFEEVVPTVGFSVINLNYLNFNIEVFDLGGGSNIRGIWSRYFVDAHGVVFIVDSSDFSRLNEVREVLNSLLSHDKIAGKPLLLLANKQDNENALDELDLIESLELECLVNKQRCPTLVESCSATAATSKLKLDPGIKKGYNWLLNYIIREYDSINARVKRDVEEQEIVESQAREEILKRLHVLDEAEKKKRNDDIIELYSDYNMKINNFVAENVSEPISDESSSAYSSESLPPIYYGTANGINKNDRPKSATQIVKDQIQLDHNQSSKIFSIKPLNKTEPINLMGIKLPHSAELPRTITSNDRRSLKSAGDSAFVVTDMPNAVSYNGGDGDLHRQLFEMTTISSHRKLTFFKQTRDIVPKHTENSININVD